MIHKGNTYWIVEYWCGCEWLPVFDALCCTKESAKEIVKLDKKHDKKYGIGPYKYRISEFVRQP